MALSLDGTTGITSDGGTPVIENLDTTATGIAVTGELTTTGNVGIGTSSPNGKLQVTGGTTNASNLATSYSSAAFTLVPKSTSGFSLAFGSGPSDFPYIQMSANGAVASDMLLQPYGGNVGIGTSSPAKRLDVDGQFRVRNGGSTGYALLEYGASATATNNWHVGSEGDGSFRWYNGNFGAGTERMRIDSSGNLLVGKSNTALSTVGSYLNANGGWFCSGVSGTNFYHVYNTTNSAFGFYVSGAGQIYASNTSIIAISDVSLKENIRDLETGLSQVMALKPRRFDWKNGNATNVAGFIAQELEEVLPELVYESMYNESETKKSIKMGDILPTLVKAIQEQQAIIEEQKTALEALTARVSALEATNV